MQIAGQLDTERLEQVVNRVISGNDALRTNYVLTTEHFFPLQCISEHKTSQIIHVDLTHIAGPEAQEATVKKHLSERQREISYLENGGLVKVFLFKFSPLLHNLGVIIPAMSSDAHTIVRVMQQVGKEYIGTGDVQEEDIMQYPQFSRWQESLIAAPETGAVEFWNKHHFRNYESSGSYLPVSTTKGVSAYEPATITHRMDSRTVSVIIKLAEELECQPSAVMLAAMFSLNYRRSLSAGLIGYVLSQRSYEELESTLGLVSKTAPLGVDNFEDLTFRDLVIKLNGLSEDAAIWQDYLSSEEYSPSINGKACAYSFGFEFMQIGERLLSDEHILFSLEDIFCITDRFMLKLSVVDAGDEWVLNFTFDSHEYSIADVQSYQQQFLNLVANAVQYDTAMVDRISTLQDDGRQMLAKFYHSLPEASYSTINALFGKQVQLNPEGVAIVANNRQITYRELDEQANIIAANLRKLGVGPDVIVGILAERCVEMMIGMMGIIKAGGVYLPVDASYPPERVSYMLKDSGVKTLIVFEEPLSENIYSFRQVPVKELLMEQETGAVYEDPNTPSDLAYIIYTSGSSGRPKGVMVGHRNLHSLVNSLNKAIYQSFNERLNIGLMASFSFDGSIKQIFASLLLGHTLYLIPNEIKTGGNAMIRYFLDNKLHVTDVTPMHFDILLSEDVTLNEIGVRCFISGGQQLSRRTVEAMWKRFGDEIIITNVYGPTECCVDATSFTVTKEVPLTAPVIPIGKPLDNTVIYILDALQHPVPEGIVGEIYIGGHGVSRGYLGQPELTAERFVHLPFSNERLYKTGDLGKWDTSGRIEFVGRNDNQVKIRGYRLELDEVKEVILRIDKIKDCAVAIKKDKEGNDTLVAYLVFSELMNLTELYRQLVAYLPAYMLPAHFVRLFKIPMNVNGKVDRNALPHPDGISMKADATYEAPRNVIEASLSVIWEDILGKKGIGIHDNFYEIGGDSIKAVQMSARLYRIGYQVDVRELFQNPSIAKLAPKVTEMEKISDQSLITGPVRMSPIQQHYFSKEDIDMHHFNQSVSFNSKEKLNEEDIKTVFFKIVEHHDMLRAIFKAEGNTIVQEIQDMPSSIDLEVFELAGLPQEEQLAFFEENSWRIQGSITLDKGLPIKLGLFRMGDEDRLLVVIHHLVTDGFSWRIIFEDIGILFNQLKDGQALHLPLKTDSYKAWTDKLYEYGNSSAFIGQSAFWKQLCAQSVPVIPKDQPEDTCDRDNTKFLVAELDKALTTDLITKVNKAYNTEIIEILLAAYGMAVKECHGLSGLGLYLDSHGRDEDKTGLNTSRTIGWFKPIFPFILKPSQSEDIAEIIAAVNNDLRAVPDNGFGYSIYKFMTEPHHKEGFAANLAPNTMFNYLGQFDNDVRNLSFTVENMQRNAISNRRKQRFDLFVCGMLVHSKLSVGFEYNDKQYSEALMSKLVDSFSRNLKLLISHCTSKSENII
jgi:amino acid adenylation domain-containing protein/non-ribosomal peptide synthase protein (TIGR01720 family)